MVFRRSALAACFLLSAYTVYAAPPAPPNYDIPLWDSGSVPLAKGDGPLDKPFLSVFAPPPDKANGTAVVIAPGGGNIMLMYGAEGLDIAERYNEWGVTAFVLTYRLSPRYGDDARILDANRAMRLVRFNASALKLDQKKIGYIGFSAGAELGRPFLAKATLGDPQAADPVERFSSRPDYLGLVYGAGRAVPGESLKDFPPTFLLVAAADSGKVYATTQTFNDLTRAGATAEMHVYQQGRHGFGGGFGDPNFSDWMGRLEHFLKVGGFLP